MHWSSIFRTRSRFWPNRENFNRLSQPAQNGKNRMKHIFLILLSYSGSQKIDTFCICSKFEKCVNLWRVNLWCANFWLIFPTIYSSQLQPKNQSEDVYRYKKLNRSNPLSMSRNSCDKNRVIISNPKRPLLISKSSMLPISKIPLFKIILFYLYFCNMDFSTIHFEKFISKNFCNSTSIRAANHLF